MGNSLSNEEVNKRLHEAAERGNLKELQKYLKKGGDLNKLLDNEHYHKPQSIKPEHQSEKSEPFGSSANSVAAASSVLDRSSIATSVTSGNDLKMNALHRAASRKNNMKVLQYVLGHISDVDEKDSHGDSALHYISMFHNNDKSLAMLLKHKPNINLQNDRGETPLYSAVVRGCDLKVIEWLLKSGASPDMCNIDGDTPLHACAMRRGIDPLIPGILLRFGANPNLKNRLERTVQMTDIIAQEHSQLLECSPEVRTAAAVQNWLNNQKSLDNPPDIDGKEGLMTDSPVSPRIIYPRKSKAFGSERLSTEDKFAGGGGEGIIHLPGNNEIIIPPDVMPLGTSLEVTIESADMNDVSDMTNCNINCDIKINLPGKTAHAGELKLPPVFAGMCLEGRTKWTSSRSVDVNADGDPQVKFSIRKEKSTSLTKRPPSIRITAPISVEHDGDESDSSSDISTPRNSHSDNRIMPSETFHSRQVTVYKEVSETSGSCDGSETESFTDEDYRNGPENSAVELLDASQENERIQHPIDLELATITEEDTIDSPRSGNTARKILQNQIDSTELYSPTESRKTRGSTLSIDSGYRECMED